MADSDGKNYPLEGEKRVRTIEPDYNVQKKEKRFYRFISDISYNKSVISWLHRRS
jgi:hypothetical protein